MFALRAYMNCHALIIYRKTYNLYGVLLRMGGHKIEANFLQPEYEINHYVDLAEA